jgi:hypothetical protein
MCFALCATKSSAAEERRLDGLAHAAINRLGPVNGSDSVETHLSAGRLKF